MNALLDGFAWVLSFFYSLVPNYAAAIVLLTLSVMVILTPLTLKGTRSMMVMQQLQPEMKRIQARYKDDREKLNEELLKFYKENEINPLGGCLPLLVQMPVFIVLYQVLRGLTRRASDLGMQAGWNTGQLGLGQKPGKAPSEVTERLFDPGFLDHNSEMYRALAQTKEMSALGIDLSESASQALSVSFVHALPYLLLVLSVGVTGWIQQKQISGRTSASEQSSQQQMIQKVLPIMLPLISFGLPSGLVLYFFFSNLYRVGQQWWISKSIYGRKDEILASKPGLAKKDPPDDDEPAPKAPGGKGRGADADETNTNKGKGRGSSGPAKGGTTKGGAKGGATNAAKRTYTSNPSDRAGGSKRVTASGSRPTPANRKKKRK